jgi:glycosyltransferase involved in cell wall biosynthesis
MQATHATAPPFEIVHLAFTAFPSDVRVRREAMAAASLDRPVCVVALQGAGEATEEVIGPLHVLRLPGAKSRGGPVRYLSEYLAFVWRCRRLLATDARFQRVRIVHVHTLPDFLVWAATPARRRGARVILDLHEIFPEFVLAKYPGLVGRVAYSIARLIERKARRRADVTVTVNRPIAELLATREPGRHGGERIVLVHNTADPGELGPLRVPDGRKPTDGRLALIYHGTLTHLYGLDIAIRGVARAIQEGVQAHFTILGDGPERNALLRLVVDLGVGGAVTFEDPIPAKALRERLTNADAGVVPTRLDAMTRYSLSNKLLEYVHLGLPVLAASLPSYAAYLRSDAAWFWTPGDPASFARTVARFAGASAEKRRARAAQAQADVKDISWDRERDRLIGTYERLLADG